MIQAAERLQSVSTYYFAKKLAEIAQMQAKGAKVINLGIGSPDLPPHASVIETLCATAQQPTAHAYQSYTGTPALRNAWAQWFKHIFNVSLSPQNEILPLMGSKEGIIHITQAFVNAGDIVLVPEPAYPAYAAAAKLAEAQVIHFPLLEATNWQPDFDFLYKIATQKPKLLWCNYPNMPTGATAETATYQKLIDYCRENEILLVNDNAYALILNQNPQSIFQYEGAKEVALELNSLSKSHNLAGWRLGTVSGAAQFIQSVLKVKSNMDSGMFAGLQAGAVVALNLPASWSNSLNEIYLSRQKVAIKLAQKLSCTLPTYTQTGLFVWAKIPDAIVSVEDWVDEILQEKHVFITPGTLFGENGKRYIRISLCNDTSVFEEVLQRLA
ncbi:MAG: aminotransferase class I/II-fold pyridoxal phosphate-dependent enzyme [Chitinophagales bacterium]|nr:aminotransferase class I/II-fold pyridoxal phosphate-dependent enzyme [Bacteroidota bacterium]MCB9042521.1 aminotransferase class I/II-fold pyridoxal phosphate-dependent enzyme [Chitinophagales bacterium]